MTTLEIEVEDSRPVAARCDFEHLEVTLADGRVLQTPLSWYPRLAKASAAARSVTELTPMGLHWPQIDEDISIANMLRGQKAPGAVPPTRAGSGRK
jgi:Protein of unknown function (DUF2442)